MKSMKKSIFKASFEESLDLLDDGPLQYSKKEYYEHLGKGLNNGIPSIGFRIKNILFSIFFVFGGNFLLAVFANSLNNADPKDLTLPIYKPQLLTPEIFLLGSFIWLVLIIVGKIFREPFIRPYRHRFHILTYLIWLGIEFNLLGITVALPTLTLVAIAGIYFLLFILALLFIRTESRILKNRFFGEISENTLVDRVVRFIALYGSGVLGIAVILKIILSNTGIVVSPHLTLLGLLLVWIGSDIALLAMIVFMEFPFFLEGYYKWKYPEEYREWEGKTVEEWYGKKYLKKHKELLK